MIIDLRRLRKVLWPALFLLLIIGILLYHNSFLKLFYPLQYENLVFKYASQNKVDPLLVEAIMRTESKFRSTAESVSGARGIMQIMPETGTWIANQIGINNFHPDLLYDPETNIKMGCWYLASLKVQFNGDYILMVAAYNGGRGNVEQWLKEERWTGEHKNLDQIPFKETRQYVKKVMDTYDIYKKIYY